MKTFQVPYELTGYVMIEAADSVTAAKAGKAMVEKIERHAAKSYPQWVEPGVYYVSLASEIEAALQYATGIKPE